MKASVESEMLNYINFRLESGALSVTASDVLAAVIPTDDPRARERPAYRHGLDRLLRRNVINAINDVNGVRHYFIGQFASGELRSSLGLNPGSAHVD